MDHKVKSFEEIEKISVDLKKQGNAIVTCNGCFDIIHAGHVRFLREAKEQGDILIIGLNSDSSVKSNKGDKRPINSEQNRAIVLSAFEMVDYIVIFSEKTPINLLELIKPAVHVNGSEYGENCIEAPTVKKYGGRIHLIGKYYGLSTTKQIEAINRIK